MNTNQVRGRRGPGVHDAAIFAFIFPISVFKFRDLARASLPRRPAPYREQFIMTFSAALIDTLENTLTYASASPGSANVIDRPLNCRQAGWELAMRQGGPVGRLH